MRTSTRNTSMQKNKKTNKTNHRSVGIQKWDGGRHAGAGRVFSTLLAPLPPPPEFFFFSLNIQKVHSSTSTKYLKKGASEVKLLESEASFVLSAPVQTRRPYQYSVCVMEKWPVLCVQTCNGHDFLPNCLKIRTIGSNDWHGCVDEWVNSGGGAYVCCRASVHRLTIEWTR